MNKDFVSYELAVAIKACGFDEPCDHYWSEEFANSDKMVLRQASADDFNNDDWDIPHCSAPTLWQAQKWLREKKNIAINVIAHDYRDKCIEGKFHWKEVFLSNIDRSSEQWHEFLMFGSHPLFDTYEEALSDGLLQILKLIKKED